MTSRSRFDRSLGAVEHNFRVVADLNGSASTECPGTIVVLLGRQEDWEEPAGRSDGPMMSWFRRHDRYDPEGAGTDGWAQ